MTKKSRLIYEFGPYCLDVDECRLSHNGKDITLRPKLFDLLSVLVRHGGQMLEKDDLLETVWGPNANVEEGNIAVSINALRKTLGADVSIETVARRGYRLATEVKVRTIESPSSSPATFPDGAAAPDQSSEPAPPGGALSLNSPFYIPRKTDDEFYSAIARRDSIVLIKGARQVGKTSLLARGLQRGREDGTAIVLTDFQHFTSETFATADKLLLTLAELIADQLNLDVTPHQGWKSFISPSSNFERFLRREVLGRIATPLVWGMDEVDRLFSYQYTSEIFGLFRSWHNLRALDPAGPWMRFTLALAYATEAHLFISDLNQSPFNVGTRLTIEDFTLEQLAELNQRYGRPLTEEEVGRYFGLVGGHPYLAQRGMYEMTNHRLSLAEVEEQAERGEGIFSDHLRRMLLSLEHDGALREAVCRVLQGQPGLTHSEFYRLRSAGILVGDSVDGASPRCQLYASFLLKHLF
jgi:DNA-binding winged helix-turn-helix (wHTH) protein